LNIFTNQAGQSSAQQQQQQPSGSSSPTGTIPKSGAYKRQQNPANNIHRLHDNSDDEEKKTYNGNSTQQM